MKVILLKDVPKVGARYDVKDLSDGYAQNVLINKGLAIRATPSELNKLAERNQNLKNRQEAEKKEFNLFIDKVNGMSVTIKAKANEKGSLFSAVNKKDVVQALEKATGMQVDESSIDLGHIKEIGSHKITIRKGANTGSCTIVVEKG